MTKITDFLQREHKLTIPLQYIQSQGPVLALDTFGSDHQRAPEESVFFLKQRMQILKDTVTEKKITW